MKGQGAVEYIIILGVIILIALVVVGSLGGFGIFDFSTTASQRTTEIAGLLGDVALRYVVRDNGSVQVSIRSQTSERIQAQSMSFYDEGGASPLCTINMDSTIRQVFVTFATECGGVMGGTAGESYSYDCTLRYQDASGIDHAVQGKCASDWERSD